jgi:threonine dehydratase
MLRCRECGDNVYMQDPFPQHRLSLANIARSAQVIPPEFLNSPQYNCEPLSEALGCQLTIKLDFANPIRSFKGRGASFFVSEMLRRGDTRSIVCASAGNWGQAMAYVCRAYGLPITIYASVNANPLKIQRMKALGADVRLDGIDFDAAKDAAKVYAHSIEGWMVEDGLEVEISEGHGTIAMELLADRGNRATAYGAVIVPLGNGAMLNDMARWFKAASPTTRVLGICAANAPSMAHSWRQRALVETPTANTDRRGAYRRGHAFGVPACRPDVGARRCRGRSRHRGAPRAVCGRTCGHGAMRQQCTARFFSITFLTNHHQEHYAYHPTPSYQHPL